MGAQTDKELQETQNFSGMIKLLKQRREDFSKEREEIKDHIDTDGFEGKFFVFPKGTSKEDKEKRFKYMEQLEDAYGELATILTSLNELSYNFTEVKKKVMAVSDLYFIIYDKDNQLPAAVKDFKDYLTNNK